MGTKENPNVDEVYRKSCFKVHLNSLGLSHHQRVIIGSSAGGKVAMGWGVMQMQRPAL